MNIFEEAIAKCEQYRAEIDEQNDKIIIILDDDKDWLEVIKTKTKNNQHIIPISDTDEFRAFIHKNGCSKMYIDINMGAINGIDFSEELGLQDFFGDLVFVATNEPDTSQSERIKALGAEFVLKSMVLEKIVYPQVN